MSFPKYPNNKPSGVEWLGDVPDHWELAKIKHIARIAGGGTPSRERPEFWNGDIPWVSPKDMKTERIVESEECITQLGLDNSTTILVPAGRLLMVIRSGILQHSLPVAINDRAVALNQDLKAFEFRKKQCLTEFFFRWVQGLNDQLLMAWANEGATVESLNQSLLRDSILGLPPVAEQTVITRFLDRETSKIDSLVAEQRRLIELLKEKRQTVISHAVTKGLNPHAPMKPSGIEWLGDVPEHWEVKRLKHVKSDEKNAFVDGPFGSNLKSEHFIDDGAVYVIESGFATQGRLNLADLKTISLDHFKTICRSETKGGDIIISKIGAQFGKSSVLPTLDKPAVVSGNSLKLTVNPQQCEVKFVHWHLTNLKQVGAIDDIVNGTAQPALSLGEMNNLPIAVPPLREQQAIVDVLEKELQDFDALTAEAERAIELLQERRTALISAAVTGKIDVRNWVEAN